MKAIMMRRAKCKLLKWSPCHLHAHHTKKVSQKQYFHPGEITEISATIKTWDVQG